MPIEPTARGPVTVPSDLSGLLQTALVQRISELIGLTRRAGQALAGYEKAREVLRQGWARLVVQASDGSEAERKRFLSGFGPDLTVIDPLPGEALGRIFGRDYVVHVAIAPGKLAESLVVEAGRLAGERLVTAARTRTFASFLRGPLRIEDNPAVAGVDESYPRKCARVRTELVSRV